MKINASVLHLDGRPAAIQGYVMVINQHSNRLAAWQDRRELILPSALEDLEIGGPEAVYHHRGAIMFAGFSSVRLWRDDYGLACEITNIPATRDGLFVVNQVAQGEAAGMSFTAELDGRFVESVRLVHRITALREVGPCASPAYPGAGCWLNSAPWPSLDRQRAALRERWSDSDAGDRARLASRKAGLSAPVSEAIGQGFRDGLKVRRASAAGGGREEA